MTEHEHKNKHKAGLHKEISSIFEGVPIPGSSEAKQPAGVPPPGRTNHISPKPPAVEPEPALQPPPKAAVAKQPKAARPSPLASFGRWKWSQAIWQKIKNKLFDSEAGAVSKRQKIMAILVPTLFIILIVVIIPVLRTPSRTILGPGEIKPTRVAAKSAGIDWQIPEPYLVTLRDPMQLSPATAFDAETRTIGTGKPVNLIVKGIVHSEDNPVAVIGTQIVHEGDKVWGATIVKINQDNVEFEINSKRWTQKVQR